MASDNLWLWGLGAAAATLFIANQMTDEDSKSTDNISEEEQKKLKAQRGREHIEKLFNNENYTEAVTHACKLLFELTRYKSGVQDKDTMNLVDTVFSPQKPILEFTRYNKYSHLKNTHEGFYFLLKGVSSAFRNPASHAPIIMEKKEAHAQIMLISYLCEIIENHTAKNDDTMKKIS